MKQYTSRLYGALGFFFRFKVYPTNPKPPKPPNSKTLKPKMLEPDNPRKLGAATRSPRAEVQSLKPGEVAHHDDLGRLGGPSLGVWVNVGT